MKHKAFTMVELIFVIVIIGVLASVAIPKLSGVTDGAKKSAEIATISAVAIAIETANGEWSINEGNFTWGRHRSSTELDSVDSSGNPTGYPTVLGSDDNHPFDYVIKNSGKFRRVGGDTQISFFTGPASNSNGVKFTNKSGYNSDIPNKPDKNDFWVYVHGIDTDANCTISNNVLYLGDISLIDVNGTGPRPTPTCN